MGQYAYLINKENRINCEAYKISGGGSEIMEIVNPDNLVKFMEFCRENSFKMECVSEHWFNENNNLEEDEPYEELFS